ncbi:uncharacterized protein LOC120188001 [Hibiscus syriacus]|uniref:uncharacterized protein LOC120188001 n=1 Tax=Hibiscus syriacus TaxID=106335 RepID=UPI0019247C27|nr:uncharacterized protein LOC120188001 [Hibiscus syriacus]
MGKRVPWILAGDFNSILSRDEKKGGTSRRKGCTSFFNFMSYHALVDLGFKSPQFTWTRGGVFERLDRIVANDEWNNFASFPCRVDQARSIQFVHPRELVQGGNIINSLNSITISLNVWNMDIYGHVIQEKRKLKRKLLTIQVEIDRNGNDRIFDKELEIRSKLEEILDHEELLCDREMVAG